MRARESRSRDEELAAVVAWLRRQADERLDLAARLRGLNTSGDALADRLAEQATTLRDAAEALERKEHRR